MLIRLIGKRKSTPGFLDFDWSLKTNALSKINPLFSFQQIVDLDEKNQIMTSNIWLELNWVDDALTWNASEYGGITVREGRESP